jgi:peptide deformylase
MLKPVSPDDPILRQKCQEVDLKQLKTAKFQKIIEQLLDYVYGTSNKGKNRNKYQAMTVGLSANQVGINLRISIVDLGIGHKSYNDLHVLINPEIISHSKSTGKSKEGCVNLPNIYGPVDRYKTVKVRSYDRSGNKIIIYGKSWVSVLLQHEIAHLNGELFIDHLEDPAKAHLVLDEDTMRYRKENKTWNKFVDVSQLIRSRVIR